jgi:NADPH2:quinone reductase
MRALRFHTFGGPEVLRVERVPEPPAPGAGWARVEVHAAGVNFADTERRRGLYLADQPLPAISGFEGAGVITACAQTRWLGRRVAFLAPESCADQCNVDLARVVPLPEALSYVEGAAFPVQGLTAWHVLHTAGRVRRGDVVCVTAGAGGVGLLAIQLARAAGAHVVAVISSELKRGAVTRAGAHEVIIGFDAKAVGRTVTLLLDSVGRDAFEFAFEVLEPFGRWVHFGSSSGPPPPVPLERLLDSSLSVSGWWLRTPHPTDVWSLGVEALTNAIAERTLALTFQALPLARAAEAHAELESRRSIGKLVLTLR